ncbi:MAG: hypothetical protein IKT69_00975 [Bacteroidales bacterium]|nr:hypothetical protein [Bacteroidales bacterium]
MKKIILAAALVLGFTVAASAQPRAIGVRIGNGGEISYQHSMGSNFLEVDGGLGLGLVDGVFNVGATGIYNFMISEFGNGFGFYAGPGAGVGLALGEVNYLALSAAGMVGIEYNFNFPLQISLDFRQHIGIGFSGNGIWAPSSIGLGLRYQF